ncbi:IclR family transcriptional regulator [Streptomyces althioticus]|uniref:IclR family transcriptional regulator n=1 Tax=Streptomyces TaxID=1883 RepID=UPI00340514B3
MAGRTEGGDTARRALRLLEAVAASGVPVSLPDLAGSAGLTKSTAYRLVRVLQEESYLTHHDLGGYTIGSALTALSAAVMPRADLYAAARPVLRELADLSGETATLHVRAGDEAVLVLGAESDYELRRAARLGSTTPLHRGASGRAILAHLPPDEITAVLSRADRSDTAQETLDGLATIRSQGFALSTGANHPGLRGIAVPVLSPDGHPVASAAVSGPADRWTAERAVAFSATLAERCRPLVLVSASPARV